MIRLNEFLNLPPPLEVAPVSRSMTSLHPGTLQGINRKPSWLVFQSVLLLHSGNMSENVPSKKSKVAPTPGEEDLAKHPALTSFVSPPVTKPLLDTLNIGEPPAEGPARLHWLLDINNQFFCWELQQVVSIKLLLPFDFYLLIAIFFQL